MAIINEYKATFPIKNTSWQTNTVYINATSMEKAVNMLTLEYGEEPTDCVRIRDNVLTEVTSATTVNFQIKSYYIDEEEQEIEVPNCIAYPTSLPTATRGNTVYLSAPNYQFVETEDEEEITRTYTFEKWVYDGNEFTDNPHEFVIPLDESITDVIVKAIYSRV